jgi:hypothetical protein
MVLSGISALDMGAIAKINHDAMSQFYIFISRVLLIVALCPLLWNTIKWLFKQKKQFRQLQYNNKDVFFCKTTLYKFFAVIKNVIKNPSVIMSIFLIIVLSVFAIYLISGLRFITDARMIPASLATISGVMEQIRSWLTLFNNGVLSGGLLSSTLNFYAGAAMLSGFIALLSGWSIKRFVYK